MGRAPIVLLLGAVIACGGGGGSRRETATPPDTATGPGAGGLLACQALVRAIDAQVACARSDDERVVVEQMLRSQRELAAETKPFADERQRPLAARMCLTFLEPLQKQLAADKCSYTATGQERAWLQSERARRTAVPASAKGPNRDTLVKAAALRDRACACKVQACYDDVSRELDMGVGSLDTDASTEERDAASEIIDELMACGRRLALDLTPATPSPPADPAEMKVMADAIRAERVAEAKRTAPPPPVTLADGKRLAVEDCAMMGDPDDKGDCEYLFQQVQHCQGERDAAAVAECVDHAVTSYDESRGFEDEGEGDDEAEPE